jgi:hypothetical protein
MMCASQVKDNEWQYLLVIKKLKLLTTYINPEEKLVTKAYKILYDSTHRYSILL